MKVLCYSKRKEKFNINWGVAIVKVKYTNIQMLSEEKTLA